MRIVKQHTETRTAEVVVSETDYFCDWCKKRIETEDDFYTNHEFELAASAVTTYEGGNSI